MKISITGLRGFVGVETQKLLEKEGHTVIGYDIMDGFDIRDKDQLEEVVHEEKPDRILHLAAIARFADADKDPKLAFETNVLGTKNVTEVAKRYHIPLVYSSTGSAIMPLDNYPAPFDESIPARGNSVYGTSKALGEYYVREHTPHIILRYSHLYGIGKERHGLIGGFYDRIKRGTAPILYNGRQTNDFLFSSDVARANHLALTAPWTAWNEIYNIGTGHELSALEAGKVICDVLGYVGDIEIKPGRQVDPDRFCFNVEKANQYLGFKAKFSFEAGLKEMLAQGWEIKTEK